MRWLALIAGAGLIAIAFGAAGQVADTRDGLIAEVVTLLAGLAGVSLLLYGLVAGAFQARGGSTPTGTHQRPPAPWREAPLIRSPKDLQLGAGGLLLAAFLLAGLGTTSGIGWAALGAVLLSPMIAGSAYLTTRYLRSPSPRSEGAKSRRPNPP